MRASTIRSCWQIVLVAGRPAALDFNIVNQLSLRAETLSDLRDVFSMLGPIKPCSIKNITL